MQIAFAQGRATHLMPLRRACGQECPSRVQAGSRVGEIEASADPSVVPECRARVSWRVTRRGALWGHLQTGRRAAGRAAGNDASFCSFTTQQHGGALTVDLGRLGASSIDHILVESGEELSRLGMAIDRSRLLQPLHGYPSRRRVIAPAHRVGSSYTSCVLSHSRVGRAR